MDTEIYRFELGDFTVAISDGTLTYAPPPTRQKNDLSKCLVNTTCGQNSGCGVGCQ